jgi:hypothetical protein
MTAREIQEKLKEMPEADWVTQMKEHFAEKGVYRPTDLRRLLGDPNRRVEMSPDRSIPKYFLDA